ncbi:MAG TPA: protein translocase subunit SecF [Acidimicrobiales bacterium]|nr:protein translocase subunit SecF [Acidimicrobiales bacterium]
MGLWTRLQEGETNVTFVARWKLWFAISLAVIVLGMGALLSWGLNLGIEFEGGYSWEAPAGETSVADLAEALEGDGVDATVQSIGAGGGERLRVKAELADEQSAGDVTALIAEELGVEESEVTSQVVSASWGDEITEKARNALVIFLIVITLYITLRFEWKMAIATLAALLHDIFVTVGVYAIFGFEVTPATVVALLTILGFSIYDGIVVFDRVDENAKALALTGGTTYSQMVNDSLNQVLMRTLNTSITALLPILSLLVLGSFVMGATTLEDFALALLVGLGSSAYSSIFIASPLLALLKEREERWASVRQRPTASTAASSRRSTARAEAEARLAAEGQERPERPAPPAPATPSASTPIQARGRKRGRGRR